MADLCDRAGCTVLMSTDPEPDDCGQTFGFMRRVGMHEGLPLVRIYCSTDCVEADSTPSHPQRRKVAGTPPALQPERN